MPTETTMFSSQNLGNNSPTMALNGAIDCTVGDFLASTNSSVLYITPLADYEFVQ